MSLVHRWVGLSLVSMLANNMFTAFAICTVMRDTSCNSSTSTGSLVQIGKTGTRTSSGASNTQAPLLVINEIIPRPLGGKEWVELYNPGANSLNVSGWSLRDAKGWRGVWEKREIPAQSFVIVEFSNKLNNHGDVVTLFDHKSREIDSYRYGKSLVGQSWARIPDGCSWSGHLQTAPSKGAANPKPVKINEIMPKPQAGKEWVELYNFGPCNIDITGWVLQDAAGFKGYLVTSASSSSTSSSHMLLAEEHAVFEFSNRLNNGGDTLTLLDRDGRHVDSYTYTFSLEGKTWARTPDGGNWSDKLQVPSKGSANQNPSAGGGEAPIPEQSVHGCEGRCSDGLCFATWNIQNLGVSKGRRPAVVQAIQSIVRRYDAVAIQELSQKPKLPFVCGENTESVICAIRPDSADFTVAASPRIGDEQYALITRNGVVHVSTLGATYPDLKGIHSRPPHAFDTTITKNSTTWRLVVAQTHTTPKKATREIHNFPNVLRWMAEAFAGSPHPISCLLGITMQTAATLKMSESGLNHN